MSSEDNDERRIRADACSDSQVLRSVSATLHDAHWYASQLIDRGWVFRYIGADADGGFFVAETPRGRLVTVSGCRAVSSPDLTVQLAHRITVLDTAGEVDGHDYIYDLAVLLQAQAPLRQPESLKWCTWDIPGLAGRDQPIAKVRAAYWFAATLTDEYGWELFEIGTPTSGGGFIADVPGEALVIYPASMSDDGTRASALARLLGHMSAAEVRSLTASISWHGAAPKRKPSRFRWRRR